MKLHYDPDGDILLITLKNNPIADSDEDDKRPGIITHYDTINDIVQIEILSASRRVSDLGSVTVDLPLQTQMVTASSL